MIILSEYTKCSELTVTPSNWKTGGKALLAKNWYISYRFYDTRHKEQYPKGKQVMVKGMNHYHTLEDRRLATEAAIKKVLEELKDFGYNPITDTVAKPINGSSELSGYTPLVEALTMVKDKLKLAPRTIKDIKVMITAITPVIQKLSLNIPIAELKRKNIIEVLEGAARKADGSFSPYKFNKSRAYLSIIFAYLVENDFLDINLISGIKRSRGVVKKLRTVITDEEAQRALAHFKKVHPNFHRFMHVFYHSGGRETELLDVKHEDVDLANQRFKIIVKKGQVYTEHWAVIKDVAMKYWLEVMLKSKPGYYVFGRRFAPSEYPIQPQRLQAVWRVEAKKKLGIKADFYTLKHLHTSKVVEAFDVEAAAKHNRHSKEMVNKHYDTKKKQREDNLVKGLEGELGS